MGRSQGTWKRGSWSIEEKALHLRIRYPGDECERGCLLALILEASSISLMIFVPLFFSNVKRVQDAHTSRIAPDTQE